MVEFRRIKQEKKIRQFWHGHVFFIYPPTFRLHCVLNVVVVTEIEREMKQEKEREKKGKQKGERRKKCKKKGEIVEEDDREKGVYKSETDNERA